MSSKRPPILARQVNSKFVTLGVLSSVMILALSILVLTVFFPAAGSSSSVNTPTSNPASLGVGNNLASPGSAQLPPTPTIALPADVQPRKGVKAPVAPPTQDLAAGPTPTIALPADVQPRKGIQVPTPRPTPDLAAGPTPTIALPPDVQPRTSANNLPTATPQTQ